MVHKKAIELHRMFIGLEIVIWKRFDFHFRSDEELKKCSINYFDGIVSRHGKSNEEKTNKRKTS